MRLTYLIDNLGNGGKERQLFYLIRGLASVNEIQIISFSDTVFYRQLFEMPVDFVMVSKKERKSISTIRYIFTQISEFKPDIIHTWDNNSHIIALPYILCHNVKVINGSIRYAGKIKKTFTSKIIQKMAFHYSDIIVANTLQGLCVEKLEKSKKALIIHNGSSIEHNNCDKFQDSKLTNEFNTFKCKIVMVGRFSDAKDYITFIKAAKLMLFRNDNLGFVCIGDGPTRVEAEKEAGCFLNKSIFFLGERKDVPALLKMMDIGVLLNNTNGHAEGISNAIMEYMSAGLAVIATDAGGTPELVINGVTGFLVPAFDENIIIEKFEYLLRNKKELKIMGNNGRERIERHFSISSMISSYNNLYHRLLHDK